MEVMNHASVALTRHLWRSFIFHAARPVYTDNVFLMPFKATINVFIAKNVLDPQYIIDCTPKRKAFSVDANIAPTTTLSEVKAAQEAIMLGDANISQQTTAVSGLKAPPEANMSQKQIGQHESTKP